MIYVDDALILGETNIVEGLLQRLREEWELSKPEWLSEKEAVRFLGMDLWKDSEGFFITQELYVADLLHRRKEEDGPTSGIPITKDQAARLEDVPIEVPKLEEVREAQKITRELMWLLTRSRPDLMHVMSKMCQNTLKNPTEVMEVGKQVMKYLRKTKKAGLKIKEGGPLEVFTDSSFGQGVMIPRGLWW